MKNKNFEIMETKKIKHIVTYNLNYLDFYVDIIYNNIDGQGVFELWLYRKNNGCKMFVVGVSDLDTLKTYIFEERIIRDINFYLNEYEVVDDD